MKNKLVCAPAKAPLFSQRWNGLLQHISNSCMPSFWREICCALVLSVLGIMSVSGQSMPFRSGFIAQECEDLLHLNFAFLDTNQQAEFSNFVDGYSMIYRTPSVGFDNAADLWLRTDSTVVLMLCGTTDKMTSVLEDFYCAMMPAQGKVQLSNDKSFDYQLAKDERAAVHAGFLIGFAYLADQLQPSLDSLYRAGYRQFLIGGHSQGGALTYYFASWLRTMEERGTMPGIKVKSYASAPPKMGNMYFVYDFDNANSSLWSYSVVNTADPVPEMPFTTQQVDVDMNEPNPILNLVKRFDDLPLLKRVVFKGAFRKMQNRARKSSEAYQKYLGKYVGGFLHASLPELKLPDPVKTTYFLRPGVLITLSVNTAYWKKFEGAPNYFHHGIDPYRILLRQYYSDVVGYTPLDVQGK